MMKKETRKGQMPIRLPDKKLTAFYQRHHIQRLSFFGSVPSPDFGPDSDVDILVEFHPGHRVGLIGLAGLEIELTQIIGREVDLRTPGDLSPYFRQDVIDSAEVCYAAG
jgi:predicted nucleotidyltransferase